MSPAGLAREIFSDTLLLLKGGSTIPVERRVGQIRLSAERVMFLVAISSKAEQRRAEQELEHLLAELRATLESTAGGILVTDAEGGMRGYNQRFAGLWDIPPELMTRRDDAGTHLWMTRNVADGAGYAGCPSAITDNAPTKTPTP